MAKSKDETVKTAPVREKASESKPVDVMAFKARALKVINEMPDGRKRRELAEAILNN